MAGFSEQLRIEVEPIWTRIFKHPFLREIKDGTLPLEKFQYYLGQDYLYLEGFGRPFVGVRLILKKLVRRFRSLGGELKLRSGVEQKGVEPLGFRRVFLYKFLWDRFCFATNLTRCYTEIVSATK